MMCPPRSQAATTAERYDQGLRVAHDGRVPPEIARPLPSPHWPAENIHLLERYHAWLVEGGAGEDPTNNLYVPIAGHVLGLNRVPYEQIDLQAGLERAMDYMRARGVSESWLKSCRNALDKFRRFLRQELGLGEAPKLRSLDISRHIQGLPAWLVSEMERYLRIQQKNWRTARVDVNVRAFWSKYGAMWRFLCLERGVVQLADLKRRHLLDLVDHHLDKGYSVATVNAQMRMLHSFLLFLQDEGYPVPQSLLRIPGLKQPDSLPRYLTDEQVRALRQAIENDVQTAPTLAKRRQALLDRATFYLLWQGGMRLSEVEELRLEDLDVPGRRVSVRNGKGMRDRTVYLTEGVVAVLQAYLAVRGSGSGDHVFLYRNAPLSKDLIRLRLKFVGQRLGIKVYPHRLRHTCATQLLNAGCRITSIQAFLGHKKLNTTMIYARAHDQTVAEDYFSAMSRVEQRLELAPVTPQPEPEPDPEIQSEVVKVLEPARVLAWVEQLALPELGYPERLEIVNSLKRTLQLHPANEHAPPVGRG